MKRLQTLLLLYFITDGIAVKARSQTEGTKFKQLKCEGIDKSYGDFTYCKIFFLKRQVDALTISYKLARNVSGGVLIHYQFVKKESGWHPFLYEGTYDVCDFLKNRKKYLLPNMFYTLLKNHINVYNRTCPFLSGEQPSIDSYQVNVDWILRRFPVPIGEYGILATAFVNNKTIAKIFGSVAYTDYTLG